MLDVDAAGRVRWEQLAALAHQCSLFSTDMAAAHAPEIKDALLKLAAYMLAKVCVREKGLTLTLTLTLALALTLTLNPWILVRGCRCLDWKSCL